MAAGCGVAEVGPHVHSPASHGFTGDYNQFIIQLGNADCDVIGIND